MSPSPVPLLLCGKSPTLAKTFSSALLPDYEVVHICHDLPSALAEIPPLLKGEVTPASSQLGSNATTGRSESAHRFPRAIVVGKGFSDEELEELRNADGIRGTSTPWMVPDDQKMTWGKIAMVAGTAGTMLPSVIADRVVECAKAHGLVPGSEEKEIEGGTWGF